jgi:hypothetical protein
VTVIGFLSRKSSVPWSIVLENCLLAGWVLPTVIITEIVAKEFQIVEKSRLRATGIQSSIWAAGMALMGADWMALSLTSADRGVVGYPFLVPTRTKVSAVIQVALAGTPVLLIGHPLSWLEGLTRLLDRLACDVKSLVAASAGR